MSAIIAIRKTGYLLNRWSNIAPCELCIYKLYKFQRFPLQPPIAFGHTHLSNKIELCSASSLSIQYLLLRDIFDLEQYCGGTLSLRR